METTKVELGLPNIKDATERQKRDGMCWKRRMNSTTTVVRSKSLAVTPVALSSPRSRITYFRYCKKEVKTQIGFSANLNGLAEEEHAGHPRLHWIRSGRRFSSSVITTQKSTRHSTASSPAISTACVKPEGYAVDKNFNNIIYLPEDARIDLNSQRITWSKVGQSQEIKLLPNNTYVLPSGYKVEMMKPAEVAAGASSATLQRAAFAINLAPSLVVVNLKSQSQSPTPLSRVPSLSKISKKTSISPKRLSIKNMANAS